MPQPKEKASMMQQGTEKTQHHIFVCQGSNCRRNGAPELMERLQQEWSHDEVFEITRYLCFGACAATPNVVVLPDRLWYSFVLPEYVEDVVAAIRRGEEVPGLANHVRADVREAVFQALADVTSSNHDVSSR